MFELFKSEFKRYQKYTIGVFIVMMGLLVFLNRLLPILDFETDFHFALICFSGLLFGILQFALHKRKNNWTYLIHRPVTEFKIHLALVAAGALVVFIAVVLPFLIMVISIDIGSEAVGYRHYTYCLYLFILMMVTYLIGSYVVLSPNWGGILMLPMVLFMHITAPSSIWLSLITDVIILAAIYYLSVKSFKANVQKHLTKKSEITVAMLMMNFSLLILVFLTQVIFYHVPLLIAGIHPDNNVVEDSYQALWYMSEKEKIQYIIDQSSVKKYTKIEQLLASVIEKSGDSISTQIEVTPFRGQLYNKDLQTVLIDTNLGVKWTFSHDEMLLIGQNARSGELKGYLGKNGFVNVISEDDRFNVVPNFITNRFIKTNNQIFFVKFEEKKLALVFELPAGEQFMTKLQYKMGDLFVAVSSNKSLYIFDNVNFTNELVLATPTHVINHPDSLGRDYSINYINLTDGRLFNYKSRDYFGAAKAGASLIIANNDGSVEYIAEMQFAQNRYPDWSLFMYYWVSPIVNGMAFNIVNGLYEPHHVGYASIDSFWKLDLPKVVLYLSIFFMIFSSLVTYWAAGKLPMSKSNRIFWTIMNLIFGLPGLVSFFLLNHWRDHLVWRKA